MTARSTRALYVCVVLGALALATGCHRDKVQDSAAAEAAPTWRMEQRSASLSFQRDTTTAQRCADSGGVWSGSLALGDVDPRTLWAREDAANATIAMQTTALVDAFATVFDASSGRPAALLRWDDVSEDRPREIGLDLSDPTLDGADLSYTICAQPALDPATLEPLPDDEQYTPPDDPVIDGRASLVVADVSVDADVLSASPWTASATAPVYVAISGGGWHAHTSMAGWLAGLLDASPDADLSQILGNVPVFAANSGGAWFITQLMYSSAMTSALQDDRDGWTGDQGYLGQLAVLFSGAYDDPCGGWDIAAATVCDNISSLQPYFGLVKMTGASTLNWTDLVPTFIYGPLGMADELADVRLSDLDRRQDWAAGKDLLVTASLLSDEVVLTEAGTFSETQLYGVVPADPDALPTQNFLPVVFSSMGGDRVAPDLLLDGDLDALYWELSGGPEHATLDASIDADVPIIDATAASSAAVGLFASERVLTEGGVSLGSSVVGYTASDLAPPVEFADDGLSFLGTVPELTYDGLAGVRVARLADGAYLDNSGVATLLRHLDDNGLLVDGFHVVAFNSTSVEDVQTGAAQIPESIALLFGYREPDAGNKVLFCYSGVCCNSYSSQVFEPTPWDTASPQWSYADGSTSLRYYELSVTTVDNPTFGVTGGVRGTFGVFLSEDLSSSSLPVTSAQMSHYSEIYQAIRTGVVEHGGWAWLERALAGR